MTALPPDMSTAWTYALYMSKKIKYMDVISKYGQIIADPNEAGYPTFVNADLIAAGISPFEPENRYLFLIRGCGWR